MGSLNLTTWITTWGVNGQATSIYRQRDRRSKARATHRLSTNNPRFNFLSLFVAVLGLRCCAGFSPAAVSGAALELRSLGLSLQWLLLWWCTGCAAPQHVRTSWIRDRTRVSCIGRQILYLWAMREVLNPLFNFTCGPEVKGWKHILCWHKAKEILRGIININ